MHRSIFILLFSLISTMCLSQPTCCSDLRGLGNKALEKGNYDEAIRLYKRGQKCGDAANCSDLASLINKAEIAKKKKDSQQIDPFEGQMVKVKGGSFKMGSSDSRFKNSTSVHDVSIKDFYIGRYEVTQKQWKALMGNNPSEVKDDKSPVTNINMSDVKEYLDKLNAKIRIEGKKYSYRLPTEAEWEYAARGGKPDKTKYSGSDVIDSVAWYKGNSKGKIHPVGLKKGNSLGLYDMSGNVWEMCEDFFHDYYEGAPDDGTAWVTDGDKKNRITRGGSWLETDDHSLVYRRNDYNSEHRANYIGFRVVRTEK